MSDPIDTSLGGLHSNVRITRAMLATMDITILISGMCSEVVLRCCEALSMRWLAYCISTSQPILCDCESGCRTLAIRQKRYQVVLKPAQRLSSRSRSGPAPGLVLLQVWSRRACSSYWYVLPQLVNFCPHSGCCMQTRCQQTAYGPQTGLST